MLGLYCFKSSQSKCALPPAGSDAGLIKMKWEPLQLWAINPEPPRRARYLLSGLMGGTRGTEYKCPRGWVGSGPAPRPQALPASPAQASCLPQTCRVRRPTALGAGQGPREQQREVEEEGAGVGRVSKTGTCCEG